ncbi:MAG TPA: bifunctional phosphopantothenoylcysteine decarboxylase/phosphopantothenate synthase [Acidimicrobiales bacterium]|nr:bifunctional phosphopantothenoylcysteine decarboxylase/phosphopantothenate synthase [Acidimicrobiales bacterium]
MRIVLGVSGGIAAYKAVEVCRRLVDAGHRVTPLMTEAARRFVGAATFSALASDPVPENLWEPFDGGIAHTRIGRTADLVVVAPATADVLARYAAGLADDLLTATLLATSAPVVVCPAMHTEMWEHPAVVENLATLRRRGVHVVSPESGRLAGGDEGLGRMAEPETIVTKALAVLRAAATLPGGASPGGAGDVAPATGRGDLAGRRIVVSAGGTREAIDPVRVITNRSSGKQGHACAEAAADRGAQVTLVTASQLPAAAGVDSVRVESAAEMEAAIGAAAKSADVVVMAAAVADFRPKVAAGQKVHGVPELILEPTPDILAGLAATRPPGQLLVGFAAETEDVMERARRKLERKGVDLLVVNDVAAPGVGFDHDTNAVTILAADGATTVVPLGSKRQIADAVLDEVVARLRGVDATSAGTGPGTRTADTGESA